MRRLASFFVAAMLVATQASAKPEAIEFSDLVDPLAVVFDDPYKDMGFRLLNELKLVVELDEKLAQKDLAEDERARLTARRSAAKDMLEINGQDVDALLKPALGRRQEAADRAHGHEPRSRRGRGHAIRLPDPRAAGRRWQRVRLSGSAGRNVQSPSATATKSACPGPAAGRSAGRVSLYAGSGIGEAARRAQR